MTNSINFMVTGGIKEIMNPFVVAGHGRIESIIGVPPGCFVCIKKYKRWKPVSVGQRVKAGDLLSLRRLENAVQIQVIFKCQVRRLKKAARG